MSWGGFLARALAIFALALGLALALIVLMNPFGNLPVRAAGVHVIMDTNDRYQFPAIVRSGAFDSAVFGTSSSRLLDPVWLEAAFGGRFANLGLNDGRAWEQYQLALLFLRTVPAPRTLLFGLDWVWCAADADVDRVTARGFPTWVYDDNAWNDWLYILNWRATDTALRRLAHRFGLMRARYPANGFEVFVLPDTAYDAARARQHIWRARSAESVQPLTPAYRTTEEDRSGWQFPALAWLDEALGRMPAGARAILAFMPAHVAGQPQPGSREAAREAECKARIAAIAARRGVAFVDFKFPSPITTSDANYWDPLHYRLPIAQRIVEGIARAVTTARDDPDGDWRVLTGAAPQ
jgi:hypothetical protein